MPDLLATATLKPSSGMAEDAVVNTFAFSMPSGFETVESNLDTLADIVGHFYRLVPTGETTAVGEYLGPQVVHDATGVTTRIYDITGHLDGSPHGSPIFEKASNLPAAFSSVTPLPAEVAVCLSLHGTGWEAAAVEVPDGSDPGSAVDRPRQRRSGRIYIGPLNSAAVTTGGPNNDAMPALAFREVLHAAAEALADSARAVAAGGRWCIWSRADTFLYTITDVSTDNALDSQRRRGAAPTSRMIVNVEA